MLWSRYSPLRFSNAGHYANASLERGCIEVWGGPARFQWGQENFKSASLWPPWPIHWLFTQWWISGRWWAESRGLFHPRDENGNFSYSISHIETRQKFRTLNPRLRDEIDTLKTAKWHPKDNRKWHPNDTKVKPEWHPFGTQVILIWHQSDNKETSKSQKSDIKVTPMWRLSDTGS